ncbi:MAG: hypothetical protein HY852_10340 [Bradyrhizobium sp.]|uniref:hypothetical protein n=1 Tax=Bradyrhizobium sp. TaxID=376 RepID=UPI0025C7338A|nr:hypothetical protein [Bradyrhizobium sp.]MBI5262200.1 hypothetical protein [Bradyrhizobium sp.]
MTGKIPPVPPANRSPKGSGDDKQSAADQTPRGQRRVKNPDQQGQQANIKQNTTNQGYQQDR